MKKFERLSIIYQDIDIIISNNDIKKYNLLQKVKQYIYNQGEGHLQASQYSRPDYKYVEPIKQIPPEVLDYLDTQKIKIKIEKPNEIVKEFNIHIPKMRKIVATQYSYLSKNEIFPVDSEEDRDDIPLDDNPWVLSSVAKVSETVEHGLNHDRDSLRRS